MIEVSCVVTGLMRVNTYFVREQGSNDGVVIDPGAHYNKILSHMENTGFNCKAILLTHGHFDHDGAARSLREYSGAPVYVHRGDLEKLTSKEKSLAASMRAGLWTGVEADVILEGGETLDIAGMKINVLSTPGHSEGGVCYIVEDNIFCGDTLFRAGFGRYDFEDGSLEKLRDSVVTVLDKEGNYNIWPGHGESTTSDYERAVNPLYNGYYD